MMATTGTETVNVDGSSSGSKIVPTIIALPTIPNSHMEKLEKFTGANFMRWQHKILFYLTTLNLANFFL